MAVVSSDDGTIHSFFVKQHFSSLSFVVAVVELIEINATMSNCVVDDSCFGDFFWVNDHLLNVVVSGVGE